MCAPLESGNRYRPPRRTNVSLPMTTPFFPSHLARLRRQVGRSIDHLLHACRNRWRYPQPSFYGKIEARRRIDDLAASALGIHRGELRWYDDKVAARKFAEGLGIRVPDLIEGPADWNELSLDWDVDRLVVKPRWGSGGHGVFVLHKRDGGWWDTARGITPQTITGASIVERVHPLIERGIISPRYIIEERLTEPDMRLPPDYKLYCFGGKVRFVRKIVRKGDRRVSCSFDSEWSPVGRALYSETLDDSLSIPVHPAEVTAVAESIAGSLSDIFVRCDLYEINGEPVFGEISPRPGAQRFHPRYDQLLGRWWEEAVAAQLSEGDRGIGPDDAPFSC